jgi:hypothetical protein
MGCRPRYEVIAIKDSAAASCDMLFILVAAYREFLAVIAGRAHTSHAYDRRTFKLEAIYE